MSLWLTLALQAVQTVPGAAAFDLTSSAKLADPTARRGCEGNASADTILVCGERRDRYRLPLPIEREAASTHVRNEPASGLAAITPGGRCGLFAGERRCNKREAAQYGYGRGRDPVTLLTRLATKVADPDAD